MKQVPRLFGESVNVPSLNPAFSSFIRFPIFVFSIYTPLPQPTEFPHASSLRRNQAAPPQPPRHTLTWHPPHISKKKGSPNRPHLRPPYPHPFAAQERYPHDANALGMCPPFLSCQTPNQTGFSINFENRAFWYVYPIAKRTHRLRSEAIVMVSRC